MVTIGLIEMLVLLLVLGVFTAIVLLVTFAIISKRPGLAVLAAVMVLFVVGVGSIVAALFAYRGTVVPAVDVPAAQLISRSVGFQHHFNDGSAMRNVAMGPTGSIPIWGLLLVLALPIIGITALVRWLKSRNTACEGNSHRKGFPVFTIILIAIVLLGGSRWHAARTTYEAASEAQRQTEQAKRQFEETFRQVREQVRVSNPSVNLQNTAEFKATMKQLDTEQHNVALQVAQAQNQVAAAIDSTDIHELMDQFDAPRIFLPPISPAGPLSIVSPFQLVKQIAASASEVPATPTVPVVPAPDTPPVPPVAITVAVEKAAPASAIAVEAEIPPTEPPSNTQASDATASESTAAVAAKPAAVAQAEPPAPTPPKWIHAPSETVNGRWSRVLIIGDFVTEEECQAETNKRLHDATNEYIRQFAAASSPHIDFQDPLAIMGLGTSYLRTQIAKDQYVETVERSVGPMKKLYTRMEIDPTVQRDLQNRWHAYQRQFRFGLVGVGAGSILGIVGLAWGLLRIDTATKGYYTKRLFLGVPAAIIGLIALVAALVGP